MSVFLRLVEIAFISMIAENAVFTRSIGMSTALMVAKKRSRLLGFGICITYMTTITGIIAYFLFSYLPKEEYEPLYMPIVFIAVLSLIYVITLLMLWKFKYDTFDGLKKYVHISAFNCAVFGILFLSVDKCTSPADFAVFGLFSGLGFMTAAYMTSIVYDKLYSDEMPAYFRGFPALLIYNGILAMACYGLTGHQLTYSI
ncbi:MAG: hypothetical protein MSH60_04500 [Ruminococcus sp.]|nr:hypothetical protein [Ruminococcus sp.]